MFLLQVDRPALPSVYKCMLFLQVYVVFVRADSTASSIGVYLLLNGLGGAVCAIPTGGGGDGDGVRWW